MPKYNSVFEMKCRQEIHMKIFMQPVAKGRPRFAPSIGPGYGHAYTPKKTLEAEKQILALTLPDKPSTPFQYWASVELIFNMPIPKSMPKRYQLLAASNEVIHTKKPDLDNLEKTILDALNGVFYRDDSIIYRVEKVKRYSKEPCVELIIRGD